MASGKTLRCIMLAGLVFGRPVASVGQTGREQLFSPLVAGTFHKMAREAMPSADDETTAAIAEVFLTATGQLDPRAVNLNADVLRLGSVRAAPEDLEPMLQVFARYANRRADFAILQESVRYFLSTADSRKGREDLLLRVFNIVRESNPVLASEVIAEYAGLIAETGKAEDAAKSYEQAWYYNKYNQRAFLRLDELLQKDGRGLSAAAYATNMRYSMDMDPLDIERAFAFARYCEGLGVYDIAAGAYEYTADLFGDLNPGKALPASIYMPWMSSCYNTPSLQTRCLDIAARVRQSGRFDLLMEGLAGAAAKAVGNAEVGRRILDDAARKATQILGPDAVRGDVSALQLAWFYAFAATSPEQALAWSNRALTAQPDSPDAQALFGYVLALTEQYDLAETFVAELPESQIAALARGMIELSQNKTASAIETLKQAIALDPGSPAAGKARELLEASGSEYVAAVSPHLVRDQLKKEFGERVVPPFRPARDIFSAKLNLSGSEFSFGSEMAATLVVGNNSHRRLIVSDDAMLTGRIRVDAEVKGDINERIEKLIDVRSVPSTPVEPGEHASFPLDLMTGRLREILLSFPQASVDIVFTAHLDPVVDAKGRVRNRLSEVPPIRTSVKRQGVVLTRDFLMQRLDSLARGQEGQKMRAAELFAGLLVEQDHMASAGPMYRYVRVERPVLVDAVKRCLADDNWRVRIETMKALAFAGQLDYELMRIMSSNLNDERWPVRLMAMYMLSKSQDSQFAQVLEWAAEYDSERLVRDMARALGSGSLGK